MRARALEETRRKLGVQTPRSFTPDQVAYHRMQPPEWCDSRDELYSIYEGQDLLFSEGTVVWGVLVQANSMLWEPGYEDCPATAVYGLAPELDDEAWALKEIAKSLFALKGTIPTHPEERRYAEMVTDEMDRAMRLAVPTTLSRGHELFSTSVMVTRAHLPGSHLTGNIFPLLVMPDCAPTLILPSRYWSERILFEWCVPVGPQD